ncbi:unnamed protein product [Rotaria socialis]|uniref:WD repeat-containing protein 90 n=1 Tax=Rotaria socialis TaxID=392032 RepID=A0A817YC56_9BILA|nr:unnamed protein product [Rotaria socialis]CAF4722653.1 unnamed protein product [Rotaria socialis]
MNNSTWQHPYVNIFKHFDIGSTKKCTKQGDVTALMDRELKSTVFRIRGLVPANNYIQFPAQSSNQTLALTGHLFYALFRPIFDKFFSIHIDILTHEQHLVRISLSNLYREFKVTQTSIQFPYTSPNTTMHWTVLCFDLESILLTYMTNQHYHMIKSFQLCGNMMVKNCFSSKYFYDSGLSNQKMKQSSNRALPRELSYPVGKDESWHEKYDFIMIPNSSSSIIDENSNDLSSKIGSVQVHSARDSSRTDDTMNQSFTNSIQNTISPRDNQNNWQKSIKPIDGFPSLPTMPESSTSTNHNNDGIHLFINSQSIPSNNSINDDFNFDLALTTDRSQLSHLPDPILRLRTVIGLGNRISSSTSLLWTQDGNYALYPSNAIVVQMHVETQQQWFFIGHTDKVSAIAFNGNSSLLATTQTGPSGILRLWKFETRRCICVVRVPGTSNLHALDFGIRNLSDSSSTLVVVGHGEQPQQSRTIVCVYNTLNAHKGSIDLLCRSTTDASISHIRFVPYDSTRFLSIGSDNIRFWRMKNGNDLKSMSISVDDIEQLEYTDFQFEHSSNNKLNELVVYVSSKSGHIIELLYDERRVVKIHRLLPTKRSNGSTDKITMANGPSIGICAFTCTSNFSITGSNDGYVRVWSNDFTQVYIEAKHDQAICGLVTSHDQTRILILTVSGSLGVLNLVNKEHTNLIRAHTQNVTDIDYDDTRKQMISVGHDGTIRIWCFRTGKQLSEFTAERETPVVVTYAPNRQIFACGFDNGTIKVFELNTSIISAEITHHTKGITGLLYAHNGGRLISSDEEGTLCLLDANDSYKLQRTVAKALSTSQKGTMILSISPDGKHTAYVGPTEYVVTIVETNSLNQTLRIDISSCTLITNDRRSITSSEAALFARFAPNRQLLVATTNFKLLKFDSYTGKLLNIINNIHKRTFDCLTLSSDSQYLVTGGDNMIKFWDDANFQSFVGHSEPIQKVFFTDDNMHLVSIGDSIFIWDVLAWTTPRPGQLNTTQSTLPSKMLERVPSVLSILDNTGQPRNPPEPFQYSQQNNGHTARAITRSLSNSEIDKNTNVPQGQKKTNNKKSSKKQTDNPPAIRRHFIQRVNHSHLAKKRYVAPVNQESLKLRSIIGYNGNGRENLAWHAHSGFFAYSVGCNVIVENLNNNHQTILTGHTEEISTLTLSNDVSILASAQCSTLTNKDELQTKIIIWDIKRLHQKLYLHQSVHAIQSMAFSRDDRFLITIGDYRKPMLTLWSTHDYMNLLNWQDESSPSSYMNCLAWNSARANEFCLGCSNGCIRFCTIVEQTNDTNVRLQVVNGYVPSSISEHAKLPCEITSCVYLISNSQLVLCSTNCGFVTCWNTRTNSCLLHWKADSNEICYMTAMKYKLLTGSASGCLRLWNIENLEVNLGQTKNNDSNYGLTIQDEFQLDDGIISGSFDDIFDMGIVGTSCGSLWYICWTTERSKTRLVASHTDRITGVIPIEDTHIVTSSLDGTIRIFQLEDRNEILRFDANGLKVTCLTSWDNSIVPTTDTSVTTSPIKNIRTTIRSIVAGYNDGTLRIFNLLHGQMVLKLHPHTSSTTAINVPSNTTISISGASDGSVAISNLVQGLVVRVLNEHRGNAPICVIDSKQSLENNSYIWLIVSHDRRISLWKSNQQFDLCQLIDWLTFSAPSFAPDGTTIQNNNWESYPPSLARFIDRNLLMYIGYGIEKSIQIYNLDTKQITRTIPLNQWCSCFDISNIKNDEDENHLIAIGTKDRLVQLKDYTQGTFQDFIGNSDTILNIKFLRKNSNDLLITTSSNEIFLWNVLLN